MTRAKSPSQLDPVQQDKLIRDTLGRGDMPAQNRRERRLARAIKRGRKPASTRLK
jgi:hypothetical protein